MATQSHASTGRTPAYSLTKYTFSVLWIFSAFSVAQLADGYKFEFSSALIFCLTMGSIAGRIKSAIALGAYLGFTILLAHFIIALYSINYSTDQFFPSLWNALDLMLMAMMWISPLLTYVTAEFDKRIAFAFVALFAKPMQIATSHFDFSVLISAKQFIPDVRRLVDLWSGRAEFSRGPPSFVVT